MTTVYTPANAIATKQSVLAKYSPLNGDYGYIYVYIYIYILKLQNCSCWNLKSIKCIVICCILFYVMFTNWTQNSYYFDYSNPTDALP